VGRIVKWSVELGEFDLEFCPRQAIKSQILVDFISEWTETNVSAKTTSDATTGDVTTTRRRIVTRSATCLPCQRQARDRST
jgi:hypothetical protein